MRTQNLGYPRIGSQRQLKKACEAYWAGKIPQNELVQIAKDIRKTNWEIQQTAGVDLIPVNDFSFYDQVLDMSLLLGVVPDRYQPLAQVKSPLDLYFAMARGYQKDGFDITAMEMTKWFDTNYHFIVPEFKKEQKFKLNGTRVFDELEEALQLGINAKPVLLGPVSFLLLGKEKEEGFSKIDLLDQLLPVYIQILQKLQDQGATWIQLDEPCLATDLTENDRLAFQKAYREIQKQVPNLKIILANYFDCYGDNIDVALSLPVDVLHLDLVRCHLQLGDILEHKNFGSQQLSLGLVDGRNIWKNDYQHSLSLIEKAKSKIGEDRLLLAPSCSLLHVPCDLDLESGSSWPEGLRDWLAFAKQKVEELSHLKALSSENPSPKGLQVLEDNIMAAQNRKTSPLIHNSSVKDRWAGITAADAQRNSPFATRKPIQKEQLQLPDFPTTTIGSFPQTKEVRQWRSQFKKGILSAEAYHAQLEAETEKAIRWQEDIGLDVLVHGEFERNDMVEYFGEQLQGFAFTQMGWVQSYGSRCVKPPIIYGDVSRPTPMTVAWSTYAQGLTNRLVKGMLTGPVTILQWSFVRNDQPRATTCEQIALAIRDEVCDLEKAGIKIIQIDEPAIREGLPLRKADWAHYLEWAIRAFRISASGVEDGTQIHTHMCYSEFNDIIDTIAAMDADVITIECSRSQMELLDAFVQFEYPNEIGPGVYDIHSPRIPSREEIVALMEKALAVLPGDHLWVNPDCGLKTRGWDETKPALEALVSAAKTLREKVLQAQ